MTTAAAVSLLAEAVPAAVVTAVALLAMPVPTPMLPVSVVSAALRTAAGLGAGLLAVPSGKTEAAEQPDTEHGTQRQDAEGVLR